MEAVRELGAPKRAGNAPAGPVSSVLRCGSTTRLTGGFEAKGPLNAAVKGRLSFERHGATLVIRRALETHERYGAAALLGPNGLRAPARNAAAAARCPGNTKRATATANDAGGLGSVTLSIYVLTRLTTTH